MKIIIVCADCMHEDDDDRQFITDFANGKFEGSFLAHDKNVSYEIKDDEDFDDFIHGKKDEDLRLIAIVKRVNKILSKS